jgi:RimJ/RimL family protein N-acetyltransferase
MKIRRLAPPDAVRYRTLMLEAYDRHPEAFTSSVAERAALPLSWWQARLSDGGSAGDIVIGGFVDDSLAGVVGLSFEKREKAKHKATLFGMYVPPDFRQSGVGSKLVRAALEVARGRAGVRVVQLTVTEGNPAAQALYERCGFVAFGVEPLAVAVNDGFVSKVHMWRELDDAALP